METHVGTSDDINSNRKQDIEEKMLNEKRGTDAAISFNES